MSRLEDLIAQASARRAQRIADNKQRALTEIELTLGDELFRLLNVQLQSNTKDEPWAEFTARGMKFLLTVDGTTIIAYLDGSTTKALIGSADDLLLFIGKFAPR